MKEQMLDANFPRDAEGRTYHVGTKPGEVANRIITVGDYTRARRIAASFDKHRPTFEHESHRKFLTLTGTYRDVPITVVAVGMGFSVIDFFVRECRAVVQGEMIVVRVGSCGCITNEADIGTVVVPFESIGVVRNYDDFYKPYVITKPLPCDRDVHDKLRDTLQATLPAPSRSSAFAGKAPIVLGDVMNASADSFYSSQGRQSTLFRDENGTLISDLQARYPSLATFEMETYLLNHLTAAANASESVKSGHVGRMRTGAVQMIFANRATQRFIAPDEVQMLEEWVGGAVCQALASIEIASDVSLSLGYCLLH